MDLQNTTCHISSGHSGVLDYNLAEMMDLERTETSLTVSTLLLEDPIVEILRDIL